jgi:hypothetical protein
MPAFLRFVLVFAMCLPCLLFAQSQGSPDIEKLSSEAGGWRISADETGFVSFEARHNGEWDHIDMRRDEFRGPQWYGFWAGYEHRIPLYPVAGKSLAFEGHSDDMVFTLQYQNIDERLAIVATMRNEGTTFQPITAGIKLGFDSYMATYPEWNDKQFPTLLRCEKTHFWGYTMDPRGRILGISSPDPVASWSIDYNKSPSKSLGSRLMGSKHRIYTLNVDLMNDIPLPERHPQDLHTFPKGDEQKWTIFIEPIDQLENVKPRLADACKAPMIDIDRYTVAAGEESRVTIFSEEYVTLSVTRPDGTKQAIPVQKNGNDQWTAQYQPAGEPGLYTLTATNSSGKQSEASIHLRRSWSWYLSAARKEALRVLPTDTHHIESWMNFYTYMLAEKHLPDATLDKQTNQVFENLYPKLYDEKTQRKTEGLQRIQDSAYFASILALRYSVMDDIKDLENAAALVDFLINECQGEDGAYYSHHLGYYGGTGVHYTSVSYLAKSIMEVIAQERTRTEPIWRERTERHYQSVKRAIDDLARRKDNIQTEGELTFEDGMISCSTLQLALFALKQDDSAQRARYTESAQFLEKAHRCLTQLLNPDARMNGATLRFWETQYTILIFDNMMNSPCGWSAWKIYANYYLYLLTGTEYYLQDAMNALGSCVQVIDTNTGKLRWGFVPDPYIRTKRYMEVPEGSNQPALVEDLIGDEYVDMISDWHRTLPLPREKWGIDNLVHEIFKCMEEVSLTSAYVLERADGEIITWNCRAEQQGGTLHIVPAESLVSRVHLNLRNEHKVDVQFDSGASVTNSYTGMQWVGPGGVPELIR